MLLILKNVAVRRPSFLRPWTWQIYFWCYPIRGDSFPEFNWGHTICRPPQVQRIVPRNQGWHRITAPPRSGPHWDMVSATEESRQIICSYWIHCFGVWFELQTEVMAIIRMLQLFMFILIVFVLIGVQLFMFILIVFVLIGAPVLTDSKSALLPTTHRAPDSLSGELFCRSPLMDAPLPSLSRRTHGDLPDTHAPCRSQVMPGQRFSSSMKHFSFVLNSSINKSMKRNTNWMRHTQLLFCPALYLSVESRPCSYRRARDSHGRRSQHRENRWGAGEGPRHCLQSTLR